MFHVKEARDRMAQQRWERLNKEKKAWLEARPAEAKSLLVKNVVSRKPSSNAGAG